MNLSPASQDDPRRIAFISTYVPRQCGIGTFSADLREAMSRQIPAAQCWAVAMNDVAEGYAYPDAVRFEIDQNRPADYRLAADFLDMSQLDVVCVQHEYGIYGGPDGRHVLDLIGGLRMPVITTLHTVLAEPTEGQQAVLLELARISDRLVVMSHRAEEILRSVYELPQERVAVIPHGIPDLPFADPNFYKDQFGVEGRKVVLTFGLLSPGKGIEVMIEALPEVVRVHPEVTYIVLGATHPQLRRREGEAYRLSLKRLARERGVEDHIIFHNRYVEFDELCEFLGVADIYVTPYLGREQITSGTLAYALGAGKAVVSTPYAYAEEMLAEGRGRLVPFQDPARLAEQVSDLLTHEVERHHMRKLAYSFTRSMIWPEVARSYLGLIHAVRAERERRPRTVFRARTLRSNPLDLPDVDLRHLCRMTDDVGMLQHARFVVPDRAHGYCTDDNARALTVILQAADLHREVLAWEDTAFLYLAFLQHALDPETGRFRNFMGYDRRWLEDVGSEDSHGRAVWGLGTAVALSPSEGLREVALHLFERALPALESFTSPRAWAFGLVGIHAYLRRFGGATEVRRMRRRLADLLAGRVRAAATDEWPWLEETLAYGNAKIPHALILSGQWLQDVEMTEAGLRMLDWLLKIQTDPRGHFVPIGNRGWYRRGREKARFDQQPIEAADTVEACLEAYRMSKEIRWKEAARTCFEWFLGRNDLEVALYDHRTGGCCDGLSADGPNRNQGAESTLSWLLSLLAVSSPDDLEERE